MSRWKSVTELDKRLNEYYAYCGENEKPLTMSGIMAYLSITREEFSDYISGKYDTGTEKFSESLKKARLLAEAYAEESLYTQKNISGIILILKNNFGWTDKQEAIAESDKDMEVRITVLSENGQREEEE